MSRRRERAASKAATQPDKEALMRAYDLCKLMSRDEWEFILATPLATATPPPDAGHCVQKGTVTCSGKWLTITEEGLRRLDPRISPTWFLALARMPPKEVLERLVRDGIILNIGGFPALTPFGAIVQVQLHEARDYVAAHLDSHDAREEVDRED